MKITTKGRYGIRVMAALAKCYGEGPVSVKCISERERISVDYVEQLFVKLRRCGFVRSVRGPGGGFLLAVPPSGLRVIDIMECVGESVNLAPCILVGKGGCHNCPLCGACVTRHFFEEVTAKLKGMMVSVSLADLCKGSGESQDAYAGTRRGKRGKKN